MNDKDDIKKHNTSHHKDSTHKHKESDDKAEKEERKVEESTDISIDVLNTQVKELQEELARANNTVLRHLADYQNYKKRVENEKKSWSMVANTIMIGKILEVIDDFELTFKNIPEDLHESQWFTGLSMVLAKLKSIVDNEGLERIDVKEGDLYNPALQEVVGTVESDEDNRVIQVLSAGYKIEDRIVRPVKVIVSKKGLK